MTSLAVDVSATGALGRARRLQERILAAGHPTMRRNRDPTAEALHREIRTYLLKASDQRLIKESPVDVRRLLVLSDRNGGAVVTKSIAVGSVRNFRRDPSFPQFRRPDGGWFDFQLSVREEGGVLEVLAYDFELRLSTKEPVEFLRFDLNPADHANNADGLRSHVHLGSDDDGFSIAAPILSPFEILDVFLHGIAATGRLRLP